MEQEQKLELSIKDANEILSYLGNKPWIETNALIVLIKNLKIVGSEPAPPVAVE